MPDMSHGSKHHVTATIIPKLVRSPRSSRLGLMAFALILFFGTFAMPMWSLASEVRSDDDVSIEATETVNDDLYVAAGEFSLVGTANRDVYAAAGRVDVPGSVFGSITVTGGEITISGSVARTARIAAGDTEISGTIGGDLLIFGGTTRLEEGATVQGDVHILGGRFIQQGSVRGDITGSVGQLTLDGEVGGNVDVDVETIAVTPAAQIAGSVDYASPDGPQFSASPNIAGDVTYRSTSPWGPGEAFQGRLFSPLVRTLWLLMAGALIIALAPRFAGAVSTNVRRPWVAAIVGIVSIVLIPIVAILLMATIVGIPVGLIVVALYVIALYLSQVVVGQRLGTVLLPRSWNDGSRGYLLLAMTIGVILISAFRFIPVPYVGSAVKLLVAIVGLGASVLLIRQLRPGYRNEPIG